MEKTILIAGKDFPDGREFSAGAVLHGYECVITASPLAENLKSDDGSQIVLWNRASALSSRSLVLAAMNKTGSLDEAVLIFDEKYYAPSYGNPGAAESNKAFDELILGYHYLTSELLLRFSQRKLSGLGSKPGKIIFLYKSNPSEAQAILNPSIKNTTSVLSKSLVAAAGSAFRAFAENVATSMAETDDVTPVLIECDSLNETAKNDNVLMSWLCSYLEQIDSLKKELTPKQKVSWIKAGAKSPGGFTLFK